MGRKKQEKNAGGKTTTDLSSEREEPEGKKKRKTKQKDSCYSKALRAHFQMRHSTSVHINK